MVFLAVPLTLVLLVLVLLVILLLEDLRQTLIDFLFRLDELFSKLNLFRFLVQLILFLLFLGRWLDFWNHDRLGHRLGHSLFLLTLLGWGLRLSLDWGLRLVLCLVLAAGNLLLGLLLASFFL